MRTTVTLADDVAVIVEARRRDAGTGVSEVVNDLIRAGAARQLASTAPPPPIPTFAMGPPRIDVTNIGEVLALLDEDG